MRTIGNLLDGAWVQARSGTRRERTNPADNREVVVAYPAMAADDALAAVDAASRALPSWAGATWVARGRILLDAATALRAEADGLVDAVVAENGKVRAEAAAEVGTAIGFFEYFGGLARAPIGTVLADRRDNVHTTTLTEPLGVVTLITPWNDPLATVARKLAPALLCGNTIVLKPAPETPLSAHLLATGLETAGLPAGVLNVVTGPAEAMSPVLLHDPRVQAVSFTGSTEVGQRLHRELAGTTRRLQTEMGGKNTALVLPDADLDLATAAIVSAGFGQGGQRCTAISRVAVHEAVATELEHLLSARLDELRVGPGADERSSMGPMVTAEHLERVLTAVDRATRRGARCVTGGRRIDGGDLTYGNFVAPTLVSDVPEESPAWTEEIFGPVVALRKVTSFDEGVRAVNSGRYGLAASIFTTDLGAAHRFTRDVVAGQVAVNLPSTGWDVHTPFGGFKESGSSFKEHGVEGLQFYSRTKSVAVNYGP